MFGFGKPKCKLCKTEITEEPYEKDGKKFHSKNCSDEYRRLSRKSHACCH